MRRLASVLCVYTAVQLVGTANAFATHGGPWIDVFPDDDENTDIAWNNSSALLGEDIPFARTFDSLDAIANAPAFRLPSGTTETGTAVSFQVTTPLMHWNHQDTTPSWSLTQGGEYIRITQDGSEVAVITDGVSADSPDSVAVSEDYVVGTKAVALHTNEIFPVTFTLHSPGGTLGGPLGGYGFGMRVHAWLTDDGGGVLDDYGWSEPFFLTFRNRPLGDPPPAGWMTPEQLVTAVEQGHAIVQLPEPSVAMSLWIVGAVVTLWQREKRKVY